MLIAWAASAPGNVFDRAFDANLPVGIEGVGNQVGEEYAVAQFREVVDVGRRGKANVNDAQAWFSLEPLAQGRPSAGVARDARSREPGILGLRSIILLFVEPTA